MTGPPVPPDRPPSGNADPAAADQRPATGEVVYTVATPTRRAPSPNALRRTSREGEPLRLGPLLADVRRRWILLLLGGAVGVAGGLVMARRVPPVYRATATIRLSSVRSSLAGPLGTDPGRENLTGTDPLLSTLQLLRTRSLATRVVDAPGGGLLRTRIAAPADPAMFRGVQVDSSVDAGRIALAFDDAGVHATSEGRTATARYGDLLVVGPVRLTVPARPSVDSAELSLVERAVAAGRVQRAITARPRQGTDVVDVSFDAAAPDLAVGAVNLVADVYRATILDHERGRLRERARFVEQRLQQTTVALADAQEALTRFRVRQRAFSTRDDMEAARSGYVQADQRRREMSAERGLVGRLLERATASDGAERDEAIRSLAAAMSTGATADPTFEDVYRQLTRLQASRDSLTRGPMARAATNPDVLRLDALVGASTQRLLDVARARASGLDARIAALDGLAARSAGELRDLPRVEEREVQLLSRVDQLTRTAELLAGEFQRAQISEAGEDGSVDVIDYAASAGPLGIGLPRQLAFGGLLGTAAGSVLALFVSARDRSIRRRHQIVEELHIPELGLIPRIDPVVARSSTRGLLPRRDGRRPDAPLADLRSVTAEAYRMVRTNLLYASAAGMQRTVAITSPLPRDGKTTVACNLAVACASAQRRVLLVDADTRQPAVHRVFALPRAPGLIDEFAGRQPLAALIRRTAIPGLDVLPAGELGDAVQDVVQGEALVALLRRAATAYAIVIVDCPPVLLTADAAILAAHCEDVVLVLRAGQTEMDAGAQAIAQLQAVGAHIVGAVLNNPDGKAEGYAPSSYYGGYAGVAE